MIHINFKLIFLTNVLNILTIRTFSSTWITFSCCTLRQCVTYHVNTAVYTYLTNCGIHLSQGVSSIRCVKVELRKICPCCSPTISLGKSTCIVGKNLYSTRNNTIWVNLILLVILTYYQVIQFDQDFLIDQTILGG